MSVDAAAEEASLSMSQLSMNSQGSAVSQSEDWDKSEQHEGGGEGSGALTTPRNSVLFPGAGEGAEAEAETPGSEGVKGKRKLSELLKLYAEKGTDVKFSPEEATRVADVLGQWINSESSPYEGEDDFFSRSQDDLSLKNRSPSAALDMNGRPRGQSESVVNSRPSSSAGTAKPS